MRRMVRAVCLEGLDGLLFLLLGLAKRALLNRA
jgi:hypothetical protein